MANISWVCPTLGEADLEQGCAVSSSGVARWVANMTNSFGFRG